MCLCLNTSVSLQTPACELVGLVSFDKVIYMFHCNRELMSMCAEVHWYMLLYGHRHMYISNCSVSLLIVRQKWKKVLLSFMYTVTDSTYQWSPTFADPWETTLSE